jgi:cobalt/nickel transport system ATP-binding protein
MEENLFELENLSFLYLDKFSALYDITMQINKGQSIAILGANGSGKSTLLHILNGLIYPQKGTARAFGRVLNQNAFDDEKFRRYFRSRVGLLFQNPDAQLFSPTVEEELYFGPLQLDLPLGEAKNKIEEVCRLLDIKKILARAPYQLSIGEKKKVAIASILAIEPDIMLLDEPSAGLDPRTNRELIDLIMEYHEQGKTIITATHDLHLVSEIATHIYILDEQRTIAASGKASDILVNQDLLLKHNLMHIHVHKHPDTLHKHPHQHDKKS